MYQANAFILKATSALCLRPNYVPGFQAGGVAEPQPLVMERAVVESTASAIARYCARFHQPGALIILDGEEAMFASPDWVRHAVKVFREQMPLDCTTTFTIQTDGSFLDRGWLDLCADLGISVTIKLDRLVSARKNAAVHSGGASAYIHSLAAIERIQHHNNPVLCGVLCVADPNDDGRALYRHLRALGITIIDFLMPTEANWDYPPIRVSSPTPFADYLIPVFDEWWNENHPDVRIGFFDRLLRLMVGSRVHSDSLGADPLTSVVVDCNGGIEPVPALRRSGAGAAQVELNITRDSIEQIFQQPIFRKALAGQESLCQTCRQCEIRDVCGGGYLPSRFSQLNGLDNPSVYCADLTKLIHHAVNSCTHQIATA